jgi:agmatinase
MEFLRPLFAVLPIRAMDVVEIAPPLDSSDITTVAALKLLYEVFDWKTATPR